MGVQHGFQIRTSAVDSTVNDIACLVDAQPQRIIDDAAIDVDLDQVGGGDFVEQQAKGVDQEVLVRPWHAGREVRVDMVGPAKQRRQAIGGGQLDPHLPLLAADSLAHRAGGIGDDRQ
ncbi:hypothetical protein D3C76_1462580 [compost metagenome]